MANSTVSISPSPGFPDSVALRQQVIAACQYMVNLGFFIGTWGNIAVRLTDGLLVTPSRLDYATMQPDDLVVVSWSGSRLRGHRVPSSETELHRLILLARPDLSAVVHSHSPNCSALAAAHWDLPVCVEDMAQIIGGEVRCAEYVPGGRHRDLAEAACRAIGKNASAVLLANHGPVVGGRDLQEAVVAGQVLEKAAGVYLSARPPGQVHTIPAELVEEERHRFLFKYGKEDTTASKE